MLFISSIQNVSAYPLFKKLVHIGIVSNEWISKQALHHTLTGFGKVPKKTPKRTHEKRSMLPTIQTPHPGTSYNPTFRDHQALVKDVFDNETKLMKEEAHIHRVTCKMFSKVTEQERNVRNF